MADLYLPPNQQQQDKLREYYNDALVFGMVQSLLREFGNSNIKENADYSLWKQLTRKMFKRFPAQLVYDDVEQSLAESADEQWFEHKYTPEETLEIIQYEPKDDVKKKYSSRTKSNGITAKISKKISIISIAEQYGLEVKKESVICPFHNDSNPSLKLYPETNTFYCFGCHVQGNLIKFYAMLKKLNPNFVYRKELIQ